MSGLKLSGGVRLQDRAGQEVLARVAGDEQEAKLILRAVDRAVDEGGALHLDGFSTRGSGQGIFGGLSLDQTAYRNHHSMILKAIDQDPRQVAFRGEDEQAREEHAAFAWMMYCGHQARFLDRHPGETTAEFLDRPGKITCNVTRLVINTLSKLYHRPATRDVAPEFKAAQPEAAAALEALWSGGLLDLALLEADRRTRLLGVCGIRPWYDPDSPGKIRIMLLLSHQLRMIQDQDRPWKPAAVIERVAPFTRGAQIVIWTAKTFVRFVPGENADVEIQPHGMARIPVVLFRDSYQGGADLFVPGREHSLADPNAALNSLLTDVTEILKYQSFGVPVLVNPTGVQQRVSPRTPLVFRPTPGQAHGLSFAPPGAALAELRAPVTDKIIQILRENDVPPAALGVDISSAPTSGASIQMAMAPIQADMNLRAILFAPQERDLFDACLRVRAEYDPEFRYEPSNSLPNVRIRYAALEFPLDTYPQIAINENEMAHGITAPWELIRKNNPDLTEEEAIARWKKNIDAMGFGPPTEQERATAAEAIEAPAEWRRPRPEWSAQDVTAAMAAAGLDGDGAPLVAGIMGLPPNGASSA